MFAYLSSPLIYKGLRLLTCWINWPLLKEIVGGTVVEVLEAIPILRLL